MKLPFVETRRGASPRTTEGNIVETRRGASLRMTEENMIFQIFLYFCKFFAA